MGFCDGKQGAYLEISGNGISQTLITGGGSYVQNTQSTADGFAVWRVYTAAQLANGNVAEAYRGARGKLNSQTFVVNNIWQNGAYSSRLQLAGSAGIFQSWIYARPSWLSRVEFSHGTFPTTTYTTRILSATGSQLWTGSSQTGHYNVSVLECGCDNEDCQKGTFPSNFCCTNCAQQAGILSGILSALQG